MLNEIETERGKGFGPVGNKGKGNDGGYMEFPLRDNISKTFFKYYNTIFVNFKALNNSLEWLEIYYINI